LDAPIAEAEDTNTAMITDILHKNYTTLRRLFQRLDQSLSNAASFQASNQTQSRQFILLLNKLNLIASLDSRIDEKFLREINKEYDPTGFYFEMPSFYLDTYQYLKEKMDES